MSNADKPYDLAQHRIESARAKGQEVLVITRLPNGDVTYVYTGDDFAQLVLDALEVKKKVTRWQLTSVKAAIERIIRDSQRGDG